MKFWIFHYDHIPLLCEQTTYEYRQYKTDTIPHIRFMEFLLLSKTYGYQVVTSQIFSNYLISRQNIIQPFVQLYRKQRIFCISQIASLIDRNFPRSPFFQYKTQIFIFFSQFKLCSVAPFLILTNHPVRSQIPDGSQFL